MKLLLSFLCLFASAVVSVAGGPTLEGALSVRMMPDGFVGTKVGFVITGPISKQQAKPFRTAKELFAYARSQPKSHDLDLSRNGIWIYIDRPDDYSPTSVKEYNALLSLCSDNHITVSLAATTWRPALPNLRQEP